MVPRIVNIQTLPRGINILLGALIVLNLIAFLLYASAHSDERVLTQIWNYLESETFKIITVSLVLPLILLFLENYFKLIETWEKSRLEQAQKVAEERKEKRWEAIVRTQEMWNQLYSLASQVIYFNQKRSPKEGAYIEDILENLENFDNSAEDVVSMWAFRFPNLSQEHTDILITFMNTLLQSAQTVAYAIQEGADPQEIAKLQDELGVIQAQIKYVLHHRVLNALQFSIDLLDLTQDGTLATEESKNKLERQMQEELTYLRNWDNALKVREAHHWPVLSVISGDEVRAFREISDKMEEWVRQNPNTNFSEAEDFPSFGELFYKIPHEARLHALTIPYSKEYIERLADWMSLETAVFLVINRAKRKPGFPAPLVS